MCNEALGCSLTVFACMSEMHATTREKPTHMCKAKQSVPGLGVRVCTLCEVCHESLASLALRHMRTVLVSAALTGGFKGTLAAIQVDLRVPWKS